MTELFDKNLLPIALQYGLDIFTFWDMTLKEISAFIKAIQEQEKTKQANMYLQASLIANFIGNVVNGKQIPPIHSVFPELFADEQKIEQERKEYMAEMLYKEQMLDWAMAVNKRNQAKREGETN